MEIVALIAEKIVKVIAAIILKEETLINADDIAALCAAFFKGKKVDGLSSLDMKNKLEAMQLDIGKKIKSIIKKSNIDEDRKDDVQQCVLSSLNQTDLTASAIANLHNDPRRLYEKLKNNCTDLESFEKNEIDVIEKCLNFSSATIVSIVSTYAADFNAANFQIILDQLEKIQTSLPQTLEKLIQDLINRNDNSASIESIYLSNIKEKYNHVELFSSKIDQYYVKRYELEIAYIQLQLQTQQNTDNRDRSLIDLLNNGDRWIISGEAGCGKTTLLQWLTVSPLQGKLKGYFPVLITLRKVTDWHHFGLKQVIDDELIRSGDVAPRPLIQELSGTGRKLLLLIDGIDEVDEDKREIVFNWVQDLINVREAWVKRKNQEREEKLRNHRNDVPPQRHNELKIVITTRPISSPRFLENWNKIGFISAEVKPMSYHDVCRFIDFWHQAISNGINIPSEEMEQKANELKTQINSQESLARLAQNPLLCAMICALHYCRGGLMPTNKLDLYDACCRMLLEERDELRHIDPKRFNEISSYDYEDKQRILGDLAYWMLDGDGSLLVPYDRALQHLTAKLTFLTRHRGMNEEFAKIQAGLLLDYFIDRGGILRWVEAEKIGFIHKTFQEYFAAYQINLECSWDRIKADKVALDVYWRETILLAIAFSNKNNAEEIINHYLSRSGDVENPNVAIEPDINKRLIFRTLAINCAASARELSPDISKTIEQVTKSIIPPMDANTIDGLSACGNLVVPLLGYQQNYKDRAIRNCATVLMKIGTKQSISQMAEYLDTICIGVFEILLNNWGYLTDDIIVDSGIIPSYVHAVFRHTVNITNGHVELSVKSIKFLCKIFNYCTLTPQNQNLYLLSNTMKRRLRAQLSRAQTLKIDDYQITPPIRCSSLLKILDLFSIAPHIRSVSLSFPYAKRDIPDFCDVLSRYKILEDVAIYDVRPSITTTLSDNLKRLGIRNVDIIPLNRH